MAPQLTEDEIDDLIYLARIGENEELTTFLGSLVEREKVSPAEILLSAKDEGKSTCLHMAAANGHVGESWTIFSLSKDLSLLCTIHLPSFVIPGS